MGSTTTRCLLRALQRIQETCAVSSEEKTRERSNASIWLGTQFTDWFKGFYITKHGRGLSNIRILSLSNSSSICTAILALLEHVPTVTIEITILESDPVSKARLWQSKSSIQSAPHPHVERLEIIMARDCAVATVAWEIDLVLLGADRIEHDGAVSNKISFLAVAICARTLNKNAQVVVVSNSDKIAAGDDKLHPAENTMQGRSQSRSTKPGFRIWRSRNQDSICDTIVGSSEVRQPNN
ncbi:uncharacterized protein BDR25DRAFT_381179 [Lindgomyces ingoldianus]|uniref:Uncharacterized protein n=1 Tax=Lindgomyces ingoldianus TaxID=673940 RepID=A0ACB6QBQ6_9PLEO|nr:uncharacterized protein BDR25DRAFT_381179 [Lindgomyces ingoldianus]KAF2464398.1 hypothetical protein BDR25DRAFT_381179 [Lindgomyces ingoldianus]